MYCFKNIKLFNYINYLINKYKVNYNIILHTKVASNKLGKTSFIKTLQKESMESVKLSVKMGEKLRNNRQKIGIKNSLFIRVAVKTYSD